jgi:hypothetical protein
MKKQLDVAKLIKAREKDAADQVNSAGMGLLHTLIENAEGDTRPPVNRIHFTTVNPRPLPQPQPASCPHPLPLAIMRSLNENAAGITPTPHCNLHGSVNRRPISRQTHASRYKRNLFHFLCLHEPRSQPLFISYFVYPEECIKLLLECGVDVKRPTSDASHRTPLHLAVERGDERIVRLLLKAGADYKVYATVLPALVKGAPTSLCICDCSTMCHISSVWVLYRLCTSSWFVITGCSVVGMPLDSYSTKTCLAIRTRAH